MQQLSVIRPLLLLMALFFSGLLYAQPSSNRIQLNQLGFYPQAPKRAVVTGNITAQTFYVINATTKDTVYKNTLGAEKKSSNSSTVTRFADFSSLQKKGTFYIFVPGVGTSYPFQVTEQVYQAVAIAAIKGFYFMRSDMALDARYAGSWQRAAGHPDMAVLVHPSAADMQRPAGTVISTPGGWYEAGDYNKYIVNSGINMGTLFSAYEDFKLYFDTLQVNIPESGDAIPDLLNETIYNLRWMLTMQDPADGGDHKCANAVFDGMIMPGVTKLPRYVVQKSTAATLDYAAVTAQASRILRPFSKTLPGLADSCLKASEKAWQWAVQYQDVVYSQKETAQKFEPTITTGEYGDRTFTDEWLWAATELFITTKNKSYYDTVQQHMQDNVGLPSWNNVGMLRYYSLARFGNQLPTYAQPAIEQFKSQIYRLSDQYINSISSNAFATVMAQSVKDFIWGSNAVAANKGIVLINAYQLTKNRNYLEGALSKIQIRQTPLSLRMLLICVTIRLCA